MSKYVSVKITDEDINFLVECCTPYVTVKEIEDFCSAVIQSVHKMNETQKVIDRDLLISFLKDKGGCYCLSEIDGYAKEQEFIAGCGIKGGMPPLPERSEKTITNKEVYENGGFEPKKKMHKKTEDNHQFEFTFDKTTLKTSDDVQKDQSEQILK
jgi:hypothetical protein